ncbi:MAG TPA: glutamate synthase-related protein, partial [Gammaproteobacteria bacterium]|nr:glutamate synthase-related protein [Gammaproteobacteria bacterium]
NGLGTPLTEGLIFVHNALVGADLRKHIKLGVSGKIISGFDMVKRMAIGADFCYAGRGMMFSLGCIQARRCHTNRCPSGVATQDPWREKGLVVSDKAPRVSNYHYGTITHFLELLAAIGVEHPDKLEPGHLYRRSDPGIVRSYHELFTWLQPGCLLKGDAPPEWQRAWTAEDTPAAIAPLISSRVF